MLVDIFKKYIGTSPLKPELEAEKLFRVALLSSCHLVAAPPAVITQLIRIGGLVAT